MTIAAQQLEVIRARQRILSGIDVSVAGGEIVVVIGPNGSGKTSLIKVLSGEWAADAGTIAINGLPLTELSLGVRARMMAVLPQHNALDFPFLGRDVIEMARLPFDEAAVVSRKVVDEVLVELDLEELAGRIYTTLSGGERQRIQIARVLCQLWERPSSANFLLDEPTAPLDLSHQLKWMEAVRSLCRQGAASLVVMHDINLAARLADRILLVSDGKLIAAGTPQQVLTAANLRAAYRVEVDQATTAAGFPAVFAAGLSHGD